MSPLVSWRSVRQCLLGRLGFTGQRLLDRLNLRFGLGQCLLGYITANPLLDTLSLFRAVFLGLVPALLDSHLRAFLLWYLLALLNWEAPASSCMLHNCPNSRGIFSMIFA